MERLSREIALEHIAFSLFKNIKYKVAMIAPNHSMFHHINNEILANIKSINDSSLAKRTETTITLNNESSVLFFALTSIERIRGLSFNEVFLYNCDDMTYIQRLTILPSIHAVNNKLKIFEVS